MRKFFLKLTVVFSSGCVGGLANGLAVWFSGAIGITAALDVQIAPALTPPYVYQKVVWGGIWGILLLLPMLRDSIWFRGFVLSLGPTIVQLFIVFPIRLNKGLMGSELGVLTPLFVLIYNAIWGMGAASWLRWIAPPGAK